MPLDLLGIRRLPFLTRANYLNEFRHIAAWSLVVGMLEGSMGSVVVARTFHGGELLISIAVATPMAAYLFSLMWGVACIGRPKVRLLTLLVTGVVLLMGGVAAIPASRFGAIWFIAQVAAAQVLFCGVVTIRSAVWRSNYPVTVRGRITARLQGLRTIISTIATLAIAGLFDRYPEAYRFVYPLMAAAGAVSICFLRRIHVRGERRELAAAMRAEVRRGLRGEEGSDRLDGESARAEARGSPSARAEARGSEAARGLSPGRLMRQTIDALRDDRRFTLYLTAQFLLGAANFLPRAVIVVLLTRSLDMGADRVFWTTLVLTDVLPNVLVLASLRHWGRLFDRVGVVRFRVINTLFWGASLVFGLGATLCAAGSGVVPLLLPVALMLLGLYSILYGMGRGGGAVAWNIGHLHFARPERAELYMGIHVSLTGLRGLTIPVIGVWMWTVVGWIVWPAALACVAAAFIMFVAMARREAAGTTEPGS